MIHFAMHYTYSKPTLDSHSGAIQKVIHSLQWTQCPGKKARWHAYKAERKKTATKPAAIRELVAETRLCRMHRRFRVARQCGRIGARDLRQSTKDTHRSQTRARYRESQIRWSSFALHCRSKNVYIGEMEALFGEDKLNICRWRLFLF